jgi:hypothetical protein
MQITRAGVTVQPVAFQFGVVLLSGGGATGGGTAGGSGGSTGSSVVGGGTGGGGGGFLPVLGGLLLGLGTLGIAASTPPPAAPPAVGAGPSVISPYVGEAPAPLVVAATPPAAVGASTKASPSTPSPIVLAASAAQAKPVAAVPAAVLAKQKPGLVLPYTGANLWLPFGAGSGFIGLGIWLRRLAGRFREE